jgi:hypothetical protein
MPSRNGIYWTVGLCALLAIVALVWIGRGAADDKAAAQRKVAVMSSIALQWGEGDLGAVVRNEAAPDPLVTRLSKQGKLDFVDSVAGLQAAKPDIAILVQPRALSPEEYVRLDNWVRAGGRLLVFADPALQWPSELPFGGPERPLFTSMLSPILAHWGLELALPMDATEEAVQVDYQGSSLVLVSPGIWIASEEAKNAKGQCRIDPARYFAECRPGKGQVLLVADADMLNAELWQSGVPNVDSNDNIVWVERMIGALCEGRRIVGGNGK